MRLRELSCAFAAALAVAAVLTWPLAAHLTERLPWDPRFEPFDGSDTNIWAWNFWWARRVVEHGLTPFRCDAVFWPVGHSLALHTHTFLWGLLSVPLQWIGGLFFAVNAMLLVLLASAAVAAYALARDLGLRRSGAALAGFAWGFSPYFLQKGLVHFNLFASPWIPLALLFLVRWMRTPRSARAWTSALGLGVVGGLVLLTESLQTVFLAVTALSCALVAPGAFERAAEPSRRAHLWRPGSIALCAAAVWVTAGPLLSEWVREWSSTGGHGEFPPLYHPRLADFFTPSGLHPLFRGLGAAAPVEGAPFADARPEHAGLYLRFALLALAAIGSTQRAARRWLALAALLFVLAWDPGPEPEGLLSRLYRSVPPLGLLRVPARFLPAALLPLSLVAGVGFEHLLARRQRILAALLALALAFETWSAPYPSAEPVLPQAVRELAAAPAVRRAGAVLKLPHLPGASISMLWQTVHELPVTISYVARANPAVVARLRVAAPELARLCDGERPEPGGLARDLARLDVRHVLVHETGMTDPAPLEELLGSLAGWRRSPGGEDGVVLWERDAP